MPGYLCNSQDRVGQGLNKPPWPRALVTWFPWEMTARWVQLYLQPLGFDTPGVDPTGAHPTEVHIYQDLDYFQVSAGGPLTPSNTGYKALIWKLQACAGLITGVGIILFSSHCSPVRHLASLFPFYRWRPRVKEVNDLSQSAQLVTLHSWDLDHILGFMMWTLPVVHGVSLFWLKWVSHSSVPPRPNPSVSALLSRRHWTASDLGIICCGQNRPRYPASWASPHILVERAEGLRVNHKALSCPCCQFPGLPTNNHPTR